MPKQQTYENLKKIDLSKGIVPSMGCDPEIFVMDKKNVVIPAFTFLPRKSKGNPVYWDGFQAEANVEPSGCLDVLQHNLIQRLRVLQQKADKKKGKLSIQSVIKLPLDTLKQIPHEFVALGCMPSYNAYGTKSELVVDPTELTTRWAGGHVHFGNMDAPPNYNQMARVIDTILGLWAVGAFQSFDDPVRRRYYGLAGEYRKPTYGKHHGFKSSKEVTNYGFEYRTLSNAWLSHPSIFHLTFEIARIAFEIATNKALYALLVQSPLTVEAINKCDVKLAHKLFRNNLTMFTHMFREINDMRALKYVNTALRIEESGIESVIKNPDDIEHNWSLDKFSKLGYTESQNEALNPKGSRYKELVDGHDS